MTQNVKNTDQTLLQELEELVSKERLSGAEDWITHLTDYVKKAEEAGDAAVLQYCHSLLSEAYYIKSDMEMFRASLLRAAELIPEGRNKRAMSIAYNTMGIDAMNNGNLVLALEDFRESLEVAEDERQIYVEKANISNIYELIGDYEKALKSTTEIAAYYDAHPSDRNGMNQMLTIVQSGEFYLKLDQPEGAAKMLERLEELTPQLSEYVLSDPVIPELKAHYAFYQGDIETAHRYVEDYLNSLVSLDLIVDMIYDMVRFGHEMIERGELDYAARIVKMMEEPVHNSGVLYFEQIYLALVIDYNEAVNRSEENPAHLRRYFEVTRQREKEDITVVDTHIKFREGLVALTERQQAMKKENQRLRVEAETDSLTGIANRKYWTAQANAALVEAIRGHKGLGVEIMDIDNFKQVNDSYGHAVGDDYLKEVAAALRDMAGEHIFPARLGGDEFCILYTEMSREEVRDAADALAGVIRKKNLPNEKAQAGEALTISQGIYWAVPGCDTELSEIMEQADDALYAVKNDGKDGVMFA